MYHQDCSDVWAVIGECWGLRERGDSTTAVTAAGAGMKKRHPLHGDKRKPHSLLDKSLLDCHFHLHVSECNVVVS